MILIRKMKPWDVKLKRNKWAKSVGLTLKMVCYTPSFFWERLQTSVVAFLIAVITIPVALLITALKFSFLVVAGFAGFVSEPLNAKEIF